MLNKFILPQDKKIFNEVWVLALPVIVSNLSRVLMSLVDVAMVGRLGPEALAATGMGGMLVWGALSIMLGVRTSVQTVSSRRLGQNKTKDCVKALNNGFLMAQTSPKPLKTQENQRKRDEGEDRINVINYIIFNYIWVNTWP